MHIRRSQAGFCVVEMLVTLGVLMVSSAVAIMNVSGAVRVSHGETAYQNTLNQLRLARQLAIDKRTVCRVDFATPGAVSVTQAFADSTPCRPKPLLCQRMSNIKTAIRRAVIRRVVSRVDFIYATSKPHNLVEMNHKECLTPTSEKNSI